MRIIIIFIVTTGLSIAPVYAAQVSSEIVEQHPHSLIPLASSPSSHDVLIIAAKNKLTRKPGSGMTMRKVKRLFGDPIKEMPSTGKPPITRWIYANFTVYFEGIRVIHAVTNRPLTGQPDKG